jgi:hypothetical protein
MGRQVDHFFRDIAGQLSATICLPKEKPALEIFFQQAEWQVLHGHWPRLTPWPTNKCFPKAGDDFRVMFPIFDLGVKDSTDQGILPYAQTNSIFYNPEQFAIGVLLHLG